MMRNTAMSESFQKVNWLHQVFIVDDFKTPTRLPGMLENHAQIARQFYPDAQYKLWGGDELRDFIGKEFDQDVLWAFDQLKPYSYKCDLARYCLMYVYGGIYFDLAIKMLSPWNIPLSYGVAAFREMYDGMECWALTQTSVLWSLPKRREWELVINAIVKNCRDEFYGTHDHYPTAGPLLGKSFAAAMLEREDTLNVDDQFLGEVRYVTPERKLQNVVYVSPDRNIVAMRDKLKAGDLTELGVTGANNYCKIWKAKKVYSEKEHVWTPLDKNIVIDEVGCLEDGCIHVRNGQIGRVVYGPYVDLPAGNYKITFQFTKDTRYKKIFFDIVQGGGRGPIGEHEREYESVEIRDHESEFFSLEEEGESLEFRLRVFGDFDGALQSIIVESVQQYEWLPSNPRIVIDQVGKLVPSGILIKKGESGRVFYGPFVDLLKGDYILTLEYDEETSFKKLHVDISSDWAKIDEDFFEIEENTLSAHQSNEFRFTLEEDRKAVEFRVSVFGDFSGCIKRISLKNVEKEEKHKERIIQNVLPFHTKEITTKRKDPQDNKNWSEKFFSGLGSRLNEIFKKSEGR